MRNAGHGLAVVCLYWPWACLLMDQTKHELVCELLDSAREVYGLGDLDIGCIVLGTHSTWAYLVMVWL
jgi:hypothetical protein